VAWCLTLETKRKFKKAIKDGSIDPFKMANMTSEQRRGVLEKYVGKENAAKVNALFESKLLLKNQVRGYKTWAKKISGLTAESKRDIFSRIEKMDHVLNPQEEEQFLEDLVASRLRIGVTQAEAKNISELSKDTIEKKVVWKEELDKKPEWSDNPIKTKKEWMGNKKRLEYGFSQVRLKNYVEELKLNSKRVFFKEAPMQKIFSMSGEVPGVL